MSGRHLALLLAGALALAGCETPRPASSGPTAVSDSPSATQAATGTAVSTAEATRTPDLPAPTSEDTAVWELLDVPEGPPPRDSHTWTVDGAGEVAYLFGGQGGNATPSAVLGDLWAFDLASDSWRAVSPEGDVPPARFGHNAAWVDGIGLVIFAGQGGPTTFYNDVWAYDPDANAWTALPNDGAAPVPRYGSCAGLGPDGRLWISHGFTQDGTRFSDTWAYDFEAGAWSEVTPDGNGPVARCLHGCWWTPEGRFALYAGQTTGVIALGDLWALDPDAGAWEKFDAEPTPERNLYAYAPWGDDMLIFGGQGADELFRSDLVRIDPDLVVVTIDVPGVIPPGRQAAQLIADVNGERLLLFGGRNENGPGFDVWQLTPPE